MTLHGAGSPFGCLAFSKVWGGDAGSGRVACVTAAGAPAVGISIVARCCVPKISFVASVSADAKMLSGESVSGTVISGELLVGGDLAAGPSARARTTPGQCRPLTGAPSC